MEIVFISDTHGKHDELVLPKGDILIHAGDVSNSGKRDEVLEFIDWFESQEFETKIFIAGNHDYYFEELYDFELDQIIPKDIIYLNDSGTTVHGINVWGSPVQPWFYDWAFNRKRGEEIQTHWDLIPAHTDILITHGPPHGILDTTSSGDRVGCEALAETLLKLNIKIHAFGHIHESYGMTTRGRTTFINASSLDHRYNMKNKPVVINYEEIKNELY